MSVYKRSDSPFYHYEFEIAGRRYRGTTHSKNQTKALNFESTERAKVLYGDASPQSKKAPTLTYVATKFLAEIDAAAEAGNLAKKTKEHYHHGWTLLSDTDLPGMRIDQITTGKVRAIAFPHGPWNARAAQKTLGRILNWCAENSFLRAAPRIKRTRAAGRELRISPADQAALLAHMEPDVADVFVIMLECGMRVEEVLRMRWEHMRWDRSEYFIDRGKTPESRRSVPVSDRMAGVLETRKNNGSEWVFPQRDPVDACKRERALQMFKEGASIRAVNMAVGISWPTAKQIRDGKAPTVTSGHRVTVAKQWEEARAAAEVNPKIVLYTARHEFASNFLEPREIRGCGGDLATLKKILGHTSISTTEKYLHMGIKGAADAINRRNKNNAGLSLVKSA